MAKKKVEVKPEKLKSFRFPAKGERKATTIQATCLSQAVEIYNNQD